MRSTRQVRSRRRVVSSAVLAVLAVVSTGLTAPPAARAAATPQYQALAAPTRLVDTRAGGTTFDGQDAGIGLRPAGSTTVVRVAGRAGIPTDAAAVVLNVTAVAPLAPGHLTVHPTGTTRPTASNVNHDTGQTIANTVIARVGTGGSVSIFTHAATHLVIDATGYFPVGLDTFLASARRLVDTRAGGTTFDGQDAGIGLRPAGSTTVVRVAGRAGIPTDAAAVVLNVTAVAPLAPGHLTVHPTGTTRPTASNVNHDIGQTIANTVIARVGTGGSVSIFTHAATHVVIDVAGHLPAATHVPLPEPRRLVDTRSGGTTVDGQDAGTGLLLAGHSLQLHVAGRAGIPADASAVVLNVTAVAPLGPGHLTVHPTGTTRPNASNVNHDTGQTIAGTVLARVGAGGDVCIFSHATTHLVVDVAGHLPGPPPPPAGPMCPPPLPSWGPPEPAPGLATSPWGDAAATPAAIVLVSASGYDDEIATSAVTVSTDATVWNHVVDLPDVRLYAVVAGGPGFVAVGHEPTVTEPFAPTVPAVRTSADGRTWTRVTGLDRGSFQYADIDDVAVTANGLIAVGHAWNPGQPNYPAVWTSPDGRTWDFRTPFGSFDEGVGMGVVAGPGGVAAVAALHGEYGPAGVRAWWSPDGTTWTRAPDIDSFGPARAFLLRLVAYGSGFVMVGLDWIDATAALVWTSPDGRTWNDPHPLPVGVASDDATPRSVATDGSILVAAGDVVEVTPGAGRGAAIWMSSDATNWVYVPPSALDGDGLLDSVMADEVVPFRDGWVVLGTTWSYDDGVPSRGVVWRSVG